MALHRALLGTAVTCVMILVACKGDEPARTDSATAVVPAAPVEAAAPVNTGWDAAVAGPLMLVSMPDDPAGAFIVLPGLTDSTLAASPGPERDSLAGMEMELLNRSGLAGTATVNAGTLQVNRPECPAWPRVRLDEGAQKTWRVGFAKGVAVPFPLDSLEVMSQTDSASVTRELARLSSIVAEGDDPAFQGLPFVIRRAFRFSLPGTSVIIGDVIRRINEEANPREEHLLLIAERPSATSGEYSVAFDTRVAGKEGAVRTNEVLSVVRFVRNKRPAIVVSFDYVDGSRTALVERTGNRVWRITWRSAYTGC